VRKLNTVVAAAAAATVVIVVVDRSQLVRLLSIL
jgi:hypothetical protein